MALMVSLSHQGLAQDASNRPARAAEAANALKAARWKTLEEGFSVLEASTALGTEITVLMIPADDFRIDIVQQNTTNGERAKSVLRRTNASIVINGGFFGMNEDGTLFPVGQLVEDGVTHSPPWFGQGGYLILDENGRAEIRPSREGLPDNTMEALQSRPVLMEPGRTWAMRTNGIEPAWRTLFCVLDSGDYLVMVVTGGGLTLFEAGWLFRGTRWGGVFDCDSAIALDGGGSTQMSIRGHKELKVTGLTPVQNLLAFTRVPSR